MDVFNEYYIATKGISYVDIDTYEQIFKKLLSKKKQVA